ncbi:MAG: hypothetical protein FJW26_01330 [Acidimicrobiia bacterium]|nr:hypothetical protein [Acidimicrobiia bacterium]
MDLENGRSSGAPEPIAQRFGQRRLLPLWNRLRNELRLFLYKDVSKPNCPESDDLKRQRAGALQTGELPKTSPTPRQRRGLRQSSAALYLEQIGAVGYE